MSAIVIILPESDYSGLRDADFYEQRMRERAARWTNYRTAPARTRPLLVVDNGPCDGSDWTRRWA